MSLVLRQCPVLVVDGQSTGASPAHGHLLELGWAATRADADPDALEVHARLLALPDGATIPRPVTRITGIGADDLADAVAPDRAWAALCEAAGDGDVVRPWVIHYARFERPFLLHLHASAGSPPPFAPRIWCTHEIARRTLAGLPRRGLRALAGYFGYGVDALRRSAEHVRATAFVWHHLVERLAEEHGIETDAELDAWLAASAPRPGAKRAYPMARATRLALPDAPGVYRMRRKGGELLYVGKATSLRSRVNGYFRQHRRVPERTLEMLTQARELDVTPTETALEAALLESDEIKAHAPPYNVQRQGEGRRVWHATPELRQWSATPDRRHRVGPLGSRSLLRAWDRVCEGLAGGSCEEPVRLPWWDRPIEPAVWREGLEGFASTWLEAAGDAGPSTLLRVSARIWQAWQEAAAHAEPEDDAEDPGEGDAETEEADDALDTWDPPRVAAALERIVGRTGLEHRRAHWLCRLGDASVTWMRRDGAARRLLVIEAGRVARRADLPVDAHPPVPPGWSRRALARRRAMDFTTFDRLRVLTAELRRIAVEGRSVSVRLGPRRVLADARLLRALWWV